MRKGGPQFAVHPGRVTRVQSLVLTKVFQRNVVLAQVKLDVSAVTPTISKIGVHCETSPRAFSAEIQLTSEQRKNETAPTQYRAIRLACFNRETCKLDGLCTLFRDVNHPAVLPSGGIDYCR